LYQIYLDDISISFGFGDILCVLSNLHILTLHAQHNVISLILNLSTIFLCLILH